MSPTVSYVGDTRHLPATDWDALSEGRDAALSYAGLRLAEQTAATEMNFVLCYEDDQLVAGVPTAEAHATSRWVLGRPDRLLAAALQEEADATDQSSAAPEPDSVLPALVVGGRHMGNSGFIVSPNAGTSVPDLLDTLIACTEAVARRRHLRAVSWPFVSAADTTLADALLARNYTRYRSGRYSTLPVPSGGFDEYLASFAGKKRWHIRSERRRIHEANISMSIEPLNSVDIEVLARLETNLMLRYGHDTWHADLSAASLAQTAQIFGDNAQVSIARQQGTISGFVVFLRHGREWYGRQAGFDYAAQGDLPIYFETLFYAPIEHARDRGIVRINYGLGSEHAKASRGCNVSDQYMFIKLTDSNEYQA